MSALITEVPTLLYLPTCLGVCVCVSAPHIEDLVLLPSPVLRLLNLIDDSHLHNDEEYEGIMCFYRIFPFFFFFITIKIYCRPVILKLF